MIIIEYNKTQKILTIIGLKTFCGLKIVMTIM